MVRSALTIAVAVAAAGTGTASAAVVTPFSGTPNPTFVASTYALTVTTKGGFVRHSVFSPIRFSSRATSRTVADVVGRDGELLVEAVGRRKGQHSTNRFIAAPDGVTGPSDLGLSLAQFAVAEARAGKLALTPEVLASRQVFRAEIDLPANPCRDLPEGTATLWLTRTTLLPKRLVVERDGETATFVYRFSGFNRKPAASALARPTLGTGPQRVNEGFLRRSPQVAAGPLPFAPRLPKVLPNGFRLVSSGWARRSNRTGVANVNPRNPFLFAAVYQKGWERIEVTQRVAGSAGTFRRDPFSKSCHPMQVGRSLVKNRGARYGIGTEIPSHLWWREGNILFTVSGPYPKRDLVAIATSLTPIQ